MTLLLLLRSSEAAPAPAAVRVSQVKPPLGLSVEITDASGARTRWDSSDPIAGNRPQNLGFVNMRGTGFGTAEVTLNRRIDLDHIDLGLLNPIAFVGDDGSVAFEGFVTAIPRSMQTSHTVTVQAAGWMASMAWRKFREIYVDRDLARWGAPTVARQVQLLSTTPAEVLADWTTNTTGDRISHESGRVVAGAARRGRAESWYYAHGVPIGLLGYEFSAQGLNNAADADWLTRAVLADNDTATGSNDVGTDHNGANGPVDGSVTATGDRYYALLETAYNGTFSGDGQWATFWRQLVVYGAHDLTLYPLPDDADEPWGVLASDVIRHIAANHCPMLDTSGVQDTTYPIPHLAFLERTTPYDALLRVNAFHLWELAVWENRVLHYGPVDMTDYTWQVRLDDHGVSVELQGDSTESLANGIVIEYTDVATGQPAVVTPDDDDRLSDTDPENPVNKHGQTIWTEQALSYPTTEGAAIELGRAMLAEFTSPRAPGTITVRGHIRDRQGNLHPVWKIRPGETIAITNHPSDRPRLITEASYNHDSQSMTLAVEGQPRRMEAVFDRVTTALAANGLI